MIVTLVPLIKRLHGRWLCLAVLVIGGPGGVDAFQSQDMENETQCPFSVSLLPGSFASTPK